MRHHNSAHPFGKALLQGTALVVALLEAFPLHARPLVIDGLRLNTRNTPEPAGDAYQTGRSLLSLGDVTGALAAFRQAVLESPQSIDALNGLAVCYDRLGNYEMSRSYYDAALAVDAGSPLVLNNLGYSLYLQGQLQAAIPVLQRAMVSADPAIGATSQRVLTLIAAKLRDNNARASTAVALAELHSPRARVELAASGEQRLVFGAPKLDRALAASLVANLGEDAALVTVATPERQGRAAQRREARQDSATAVAVSFAATPENAAPITRATAAAMVHVVAQTVAQTVANADTGPKTVYFTTPDDVVATASPAPIPAAAPLAIASIALQDHDVVVGRRQRGPALPLPTLPFTPAFAARANPAQHAGTPLRPLQPPAEHPVAIAAVPRVTPPARPLQAASIDISDAPAWLLASRRVEKFSLGVTTETRGPQQNDALAAFDSDDPILNAFAARMRGDPPAAAIEDVTTPLIPTPVIIARLEALLSRVRPA